MNGEVGMDTEYFAQHIQCPREGKQECLQTVRQLVELAFAAREHGLLKMDTMIEDRLRFPDPFLRKAVSLVTDFSNPVNIRRVLYNYIFTANYLSNYQFLNSIVITETILAIGQSEDMDYIFSYLVPSLFGFDYEAAVIDVYKQFKLAMVTERDRQDM